MKIVIYPAIEPDRVAALRTAAANPDIIWVNAADPGEAEAEMRGADAFLGKVTPAMLSKADCLRWVQAFTASLEHYIFPELEEHPCILTNTRGLFGDVIADQVMGYVLCFARNLHTYVRRQLEHRYEPVGGEESRVSFAAGPGTINAMDRATIYLPSAKMGIVGVGGIGREIARRALAFDMMVRGVDKFPDKVTPLEGLQRIDPFEALPDLMAWSDFLVIAAPHTPETQGLFDVRLLGHSKPGSYLINIGRGAIVVLDDLIETLRSGRLAGAALDVFEVEPLPSDSPLWDFPNVIITPHTAGYSPMIAHRHLVTLVENVRRFVRGEPLLNVVDKSLWF